jgi:hypothetical protein
LAPPVIRESNQTGSVALASKKTSSKTPKVDLYPNQTELFRILAKIQMRIIDRQRGVSEPIPDPSETQEANLLSSPVHEEFLCVIESESNKTGEDFIDDRDRFTIRKEQT